MPQLSSLERLIIKQTCRFFTYKFEMGSYQSSETPFIYSFEFLKSLHDKPKENAYKIIKAAPMRPKHQDSNETNDRSFYDKRILLDFFKTVNDMKSTSAKQWTDLQHYLCFVYRYCMTRDPTEPDPEQEILSPYFIFDMRNIVCSLMQEDEVQLCLRMFSLVREYTIFAHSQHQKISDVEASIESLFYYYEAFLSATKNICKIFPELEKLLINTYKLGWLDFNTSIFMYYFYETPYIQNMIKEFELMLGSGSIKANGIYTVLTELHKLWRAQMLGINSVMANQGGAKFRSLVDPKMMAAHKRILSQNFWLDRTPEEKSLQDMKLFDYQLFTLVGNKKLPLPEPTLNEFGHCICEDCLIIKYKSMVDHNQNKIPTAGMTVSCRFCKQRVDLDHFQQHINELGGNICKSPSNLSRIISDKIDIVKLGMATDSTKTLNKKITTLVEQNTKRPQSNSVEVSKEPSPKIANEPPVFGNQKEEDDDELAKLMMEDYDDNEMSGKALYNLLMNRNTLPANMDIKRRPPIKSQEKASQTPVKSVAPPKTEDSKAMDLIKNSKGTNTPSKNTGMTFPCGHSCKLEEELKSEFKKAYQETCDHHKESKKCDCTFCEVFGTSSHVHKTNETRNRLRIRLNQRNEKVSNYLASKVNMKSSLNVASKASVKNAEVTPVAPSKTQQPSNDVASVSTSDDSSSNPLINDIHGLLNFIEGNTTTDKVALAEKKAAKKQRQRSKKEQEKQKLEEEERRKEEIKRQEEEEMDMRRREEEALRKVNEIMQSDKLERELEEKAKILMKKEAKKRKQKIKREAREAAANQELMEETIPAMVTIKRVVENHNSLPTVTITLKGSTPDQDKLLYTLVNGHDGADAQSTDKKSKKNKNQANAGGKTVNLDVNSDSNNKKKKKNVKAAQPPNQVITKELRVTLAVDPLSNASADVKKTGKQTKVDNNKNQKKPEVKKEKKSKHVDFNIPMLRLPPGITITKVNGPMTDRNYKTSNLDSPPYNSNVPVSKSGVIVVDTEKLIKQSSVSSSTTTSKKSKKKRNKKQPAVPNAPQPVQNGKKPSMVTLKNPIFQNMQNSRREPEMMPDLSGQCQQAAIFKNENGMVTIRSSRLQQSLTNGAPMPNLLSDLKPVLGPEVPNPYMSSCSFPDSPRISPFNAQAILSGLPGIEITKVDKNAPKSDFDSRKSCHTAEVSIIPANNLDKFNFDDLHYDNVFTPKDILDDMDADERELEAFKRFCLQSVPPKRKEKVAHLNVKDIVLKKKNDIFSG